MNKLIKKRKYTTETRVCENRGKDFQFPIWRSKQGTPGRFCNMKCMGIGKTVSLYERFDKYVGNTTKNGCIIWIGWTDKDGYGRINEGGRFGKMILAHRLVYEREHGIVPKGLLVCHKCDNPSCINPDHLFVGTQADNIADKVDKGRQIRGIKHHKAVLNEVKVRQIRKLVKAKDITHKVLAKSFGIGISTVRDVIYYRNWKYVD